VTPSLPNPARTLGTLLFVLLLTPCAPVSAQDDSSYPRLRLGGRVHAQYAHYSVSAARNDFFLRRVRLKADIDVNEWVSGRVQPDFAGGDLELQDAYVAFDFAPELRLSVGQFKRSFELIDLQSTNDLPIVEREGRVEGFAACPGVGGICSSWRMLEQLLFAGRDQGIRLDGSAGGFRYEAGISNGEGLNTSDVNDGKSLAGRVTRQVAGGLELSAKIAVHDYLDPAEDTDHALAFGLDGQYGTFRDGLHLQASWVSGENWKVLDAVGDPRWFHTVQAWGSYYHPVDHGRVTAVEPVFRTGFTDPNGEGDADGGTLFTPGLVVYFGGQNRIGANLDVYDPQSGSTEYSLKAQIYLVF